MDAHAPSASLPALVRADAPPPTTQLKSSAGRTRLMHPGAHTAATGTTVTGDGGTQHTSPSFR